MEKKSIKQQLLEVHLEDLNRELDYYKEDLNEYFTEHTELERSFLREKIQIIKSHHDRLHSILILKGE